MSEEQAEPRRVLVAEDEGLIRLDIVETLTQAGFEVVGEAADGEEAVELALELEPDLCVMDVKMPKMDGITAAEKILQELSCAVVMLTAFSQTELVERARDAGAMAYVVKPFSPSDLIPAVEIALSRHAEIESLEDQIADLTDRFETRKRVDRAKGLLMKNMGMSEPEAFRWIQKTSMDRRLSMREVADAVIHRCEDVLRAKRGGGESTRLPPPSSSRHDATLVVRGAHQDAVGDARDRDQAVGFVADLHGVNGGGTAQVYGRGRGRDHALASSRDVRGVEFSAHRVGLLAGVGFARVDLRGEGCSGLGERCRSSAVQNAGALAVAIDGHGDDGARCGVLEYLHAGGLHEGAGPVGPHPSAPGEGVGRGGVGAFRLVIVCHGI